MLLLLLAYTEGDELSIKTYTLSQYQEEMKKRIPVKESGKQQEILQQEITQRERQMEERHQQELQQLRQQLERAREESHLEIRQRERMERQLQEMREELQRLHLEIQERDQRERRKERESQQRERRLEDTERRLQEREREFEERNRQAQEEIRQLRIENEERERQFQEREQLLQEQLRQSEQDLQEKQDQLEQQQSSWVLNEEEITMTDNVLGNGGYGEVRVGLFRGLRVAAKRLHQIILSPYNRGVFCREMEIASKVRHPNLLQFIGATREGNPIILTELMPTSLRKELETGTPLPYSTILNISLDVACALNYVYIYTFTSSSLILYYTETSVVVMSSYSQMSPWVLGGELRYPTMARQTFRISLPRQLILVIVSTLPLKLVIQGNTLQQWTCSVMVSS